VFGSLATWIAPWFANLKKPDWINPSALRLVPVLGVRRLAVGPLGGAAPSTRFSVAVGAYGKAHLPTELLHVIRV
jgi:hypothetical protein